MTVTFPNPLAEFFPGPLTPPPSLQELGVFAFYVYFVTTGDAVQKSRFVLVELQAYRDRLVALTAGRKSPSALRYVREVQAALDTFPAYLQALHKIRGKAVFLETSRDEGGGHRLRPVDPKAVARAARTS